MFCFWETKRNSTTLGFVRECMWNEGFWETSISFYHQRATKEGSGFLDAYAHRRCLTVAWFYVACQREKDGRREFNRGAVWYIEIFGWRWWKSAGSCRWAAAVKAPRHTIPSSHLLLAFPPQRPRLQKERPAPPLPWGPKAWLLSSKS